MSSKITVFDFAGNYLAELDKVPTVRSWVRDDQGRCTFPISTSSKQCTERNLRYGNLLLIQHIPSVDDTGATHGQLPDWVGFISVPRIWSVGVVQVTAYTMEGLLAYRGMKQRTINGMPGDLFKILIENVRALGNYYDGGTIIHRGSVYVAGLPIQEVIIGSAYDHIKSIQTKSNGQDWNITNTIVNNKLMFWANWYKKIGQATNLILQDSNCRADPNSPLLTENGPIYNAVYGQSSTQNLSPTDSEHDDVSMDKYGILHTIQIFAAKDRNPAAVTAATKSFLAAHKEPSYVATPAALDRGLTFSSLNIGNILNYSTLAAGFTSTGLGFNAQFSITSMEYDDIANECKLVLGAP